MEKIALPWVATKKMEIEEEKDEEDKYGLNRDFILGELQRAIRMARANTSPGLDYIEYEMIKRLPIVYLKELLIMYNTFFREGKIMKEWRKQKILLIDKPGKEKVRPISLALCIVKVFERMVNERLVWWKKKINLVEHKMGLEKESHA